MGSMLRPQYLLEAREQFAAGKLRHAERAWQHDPVVLVETKGTPEVHGRERVH